MKQKIKKMLPTWLLNWRIKQIAQSRTKDTKSVFNQIYDTNRWGSAESISGFGSEINQTKNLISEIEKILVEKNINSFLDIPCGDYNWMKEVNMNKIKYTGADIVKDLIEKNIEKFKDKENVSFEVLDLIQDPLPQHDIIFVRDCLVHLPFSEITKAIKNIKSSGCKYLMTTTFTNCNQNIDIIMGDWRKINLEKKPFNFPKPLIIINENCTEANGKYQDKSMAIWDINTL